MKAKTLVPIIALCVGGSLGPSCLLADSTATKHKMATELGNPQPWVISQVMDANVKDLQGDNLGKIKDVLLDPASGRAKFAIIQLSGDVGPKGVYAPVPWTLLKPTITTTTGEPKSFVLNVDKDKFAGAQKFYLSHWPDSNEAMWAPDVYAYYGLNSADSGYATGATGMETQVNTGRHYYQSDLSRYGPTRSDGTPVDNGTAPDGKGTFVRGPRF